jgi:hypothetical protein
MTIFLAVWAILVTATAGLALYRKMISLHEENYLHLGAGEEGHISEQVTMARRIASIDHWGKLFTVAAVVLGIALAVAFLYEQFLLSARPW